MTSAGSTILGVAEGLSRVAPRVGRYVGNDGQSALVDIGGQRVAMPFLTGFVPQINEPVHVWSVDGSMFMAGPTTAKPGVGVVLAITGTNATVRTDFGDYKMPVAPSDPMPTSGDSVGISWSSSPWCTLLVDVPDPAEPPPTPGGGGAGTEVKTAEFRAVDAGSTDRGSARWWQAEPWSSNTTYGAWFYGTQIKDTVPASAQFVSLEFYVSWRQRSGGAARFTLHQSPYKSGVPAMTGYAEWAPAGGWQVPPDAAGWFNALKAGGLQWGVGLNQGGYNKFAAPKQGAGQDPLSGAIRIKWR